MDTDYANYTEADAEQFGDRLRVKVGLKTKHEHKKTNVKAKPNDTTVEAAKEKFLQQTKV